MIKLLVISIPILVMFFVAFKPFYERQQLKVKQHELLDELAYLTSDTGRFHTEDTKHRIDKIFDELEKIQKKLYS